MSQGIFHAQRIAVTIRGLGVAMIFLYEDIMPKSRHNGMEKTVLALIIASAIGSPFYSYAADSSDDVEFDPSFFPNKKGEKLDLSQYSRANIVPAGNYSMDVILNGQWIGKEEIKFITIPNNKYAVPCYNGSFFSQLNLNAKQLNKQEGYLDRLEKEGYCGDLKTMVPGTLVNFDTGEQKVMVSIPQLLLNNKPRGFVDPSRWEDGLTALMVNYNANIYQAKLSNSNNTYSYLGLRNGINFGGWQLRNSGAFNWNSGGKNTYRNTATYLGHDIPALQSQLVIGDAFTSGTLFDGIRFRGIRLYSDDRMLPDSQRGYAPIVRGVANSNARVVITQNGFNIYTTTVAPGPFEISDLYPNSYGGDLMVRVEEATGEVRTFSVPYASLAQLLRPGISRYELAAGEVNSYGLTHKPNFGTLTYQRGLINDLTGYTGTTVSEGYFAAMLGAAVNTPIGAFSFDVTQADSNLPNESYNGQSYRLAYSQVIPQTKTNFSVLAYRYSTSGYLGLNDAVQLRDMELGGLNTSDYQRPRSTFTLSVNQILPERWGSLFATASYSNYWKNEGSRESYQLGYSNVISSLSYSLAVNRTLNSNVQSIFSTETRETQFTLNLSLPLGGAAYGSNLHMTGTSSSQTRNGQVGLSGSYGSDHQYDYNVNVTRDTTSNTNAFSSGLGYRAPFADLSASYGYAQGNQQYSAGANGAVVVHSGGITFGQSMGETAALVHAQGAKGARVTTTTGVTVDRFGYAIVPYLRPYYVNKVDLDPKGTPDNIEIRSTQSTTVPRSGALTLLNYETESGRLVYIKAKQKDGSALPFAASVYDTKGKNVGVVAQSSLLVLRGIDDQGILRVKWGDNEEKSCTLHYQLPPEQSETTVIQGVCQ